MSAQGVLKILQVLHKETVSISSNIDMKLFIVALLLL